MPTLSAETNLQTYKNSDGNPYFPTNYKLPQSETEGKDKVNIHTNGRIITEEILGDYKGVVH